MVDNLQVQINRLKWRSRRSMLEVDIYLEQFIQAGGLELLTSGELVAYEKLLDLADVEFLELLFGNCSLADKMQQALVMKISAKSAL